MLFGIWSVRARQIRGGGADRGNGQGAEEKMFRVHGGQCGDDRLVYKKYTLYPPREHLGLTSDLDPRHTDGMPTRFHGKGLPEQFADLMQRDLLGRDCGAWLPGYRTLMQRYSTSAKTTLAAIEVLAERGLISPASQGKRRKIMGNASSRTEQIHGLLIVHGSGSLSGEDLQQIHAYRTAWEDAGGRVEAVTYDYPRYKRPEKLLREAVSIHWADAILLHVAPLHWVKAAEQLRPTFLAGGEFEDAQISGAAYDIRSELTKVVRRLRSLGHERVMIPTDLVGTKMQAAVRAGLADGLGIPETTPILEALCPVFPEKLAATWQSYWQKAFASNHATAVVLTDDIHVLSLYGYCMRHGINIPTDLSVVCLENTHHLEWCHPVPSRMRFPVKAAARQLRAWLRGGCKPTGMKIMELEWIEGGTMAVPKSPRGRMPARCTMNFNHGIHGIHGYP